MSHISHQFAMELLRKAGKSDEEIAAELGPPSGKRRGKGNKYHARKTYSEVLGRTFHSDAERRYGEYLYARQMAGEISDLDFQSRVQLLPKINLIVDFFYREGDEPVWDEFKGPNTGRWLMQKRLWAQFGPGVYRITREARGRHTRPYRHTEVIPQPSPELLEKLRPWVAELEAQQTISGTQTTPLWLGPGKRVAQYVRGLRGQRGQTQTAFAEVLGVNPETLAAIEDARFPGFPVSVVDALLRCAEETACRTSSQ